MNSFFISALELVLLFGRDPAVWSKIASTTCRNGVFLLDLNVMQELQPKLWVLRALLEGKTFDWEQNAGLRAWYVCETAKLQRFANYSHQTSAWKPGLHGSNRWEANDQGGHDRALLNALMGILSFDGQRNVLGAADKWLTLVGQIQLPQDVAEAYYVWKRRESLAEWDVLFHTLGEGEEYENRPNWELRKAVLQKGLTINEEMVIPFTAAQIYEEIKLINSEQYNLEFKEYDPDDFDNEVIEMVHPRLASTGIRRMNQDLSPLAWKT